MYTITNSLSKPKIKPHAWPKLTRNNNTTEASNSKIYQPCPYTQTEESNEYSDIFRTDYNWKNDKPKYKRKIFKLRVR